MTKTILTKSLLVALLAIIPGVLASFNPNCPEGIHVRKEFRDMTRSEWRRYQTASKHQYHATIDGVETFVDRFTRIYLENADPAKNTPYSGPWSRQFLLMYENELRRYDPLVTLPYWDWTIDAKQPLDSPLFDDDYAGTYPFEDCLHPLRYPTPHCLRRDYASLRFANFHNYHTIGSIIKDQGMPYFKLMEILEHAPSPLLSLHYGQNPGLGIFYDMTTPNDSIWWLHRAQLDRIWHLWQKARLIHGMDPYEFNGYYRNMPVHISDILSPFGIHVSQVMRIDEQLCYIYQPPHRHGVQLALAVLELNSNDSVKWTLPSQATSPENKEGVLDGGDNAAANPESSRLMIDPLDSSGKEKVNLPGDISQQAKAMAVVSSGDTNLGSTKPSFYHAILAFAFVLIFLI